MNWNYSIHCSKNALVIHLDQVQMEEIVERKLLYFLDQRPLGRNILKNFYEPVEQALIEFSLEKMKGNQLKTAKVLGINRNTLKKKIVAYQLNIKELLIKPKNDYPQSRLFLSSASSSLDLLSVCRAKLASKHSQNQFPKENVLKQIGQPVEKKIIQKVLEYSKGNQVRASQFLGINRNTLKKKMNLTIGMRAG